MTAAHEISSLDDLRKTPFSELFYGIIDSDNGSELARRIVNSIDKDFEHRKSRASRQSCEELAALKDKLTRKRRKKMREDLSPKIRRVFLYQYAKPTEKFRDLEQYDEEIDRILRDEDETKVRFSKVVKALLSMERDKDKSTSGKDADTLSEELLRERMEDYKKKEQRELLAWVVSSEVVFKGVIAEIDARTRKTGIQKKYLEALLLLPEVRDDQDMIVFFGNNFHATFANTDAYTGLLYAYEFFEYVGLA